MRRLLTIEDTFMISGRGLIVVPAPPIGEFRGPGDVLTELRWPDGSIRSATLTFAHEFLFPPPAVRRWSCMFKALSKADVPVGTEIWCSEDCFLEPHRESRDAG